MMKPAESDKRATPAVDSDESTSGIPIDFDEALCCFAGNREVLTRVLRKFRTSLVGEIATIKQAAESKDFDMTHALAHKIKGSAATLSAMPFSEAARKMETLAKERDAGKLPDAIAQLEQEFERLCAFVEQQGILDVPAKA